MADSKFTDNYLGYLLARCSHQISAPFHKRLKEEGVNIMTWRILRSIKNEPLSVNQVARLVLAEQSTLSKSLVRLERDGFLQRIRDNNHRRQVNIHISEKGSNIVTRLTKIANDYEKETLKKLAPKQQKQLRGLLQDLIKQTS